MLIHHLPWTEEDKEIDPRARVPTLLHPGEVRLLHWLGRVQYSGWGAVIDGGCFVGGSTAALGWGLRANPAATPGCLHAYDLFEIDPAWGSIPKIKEVMEGARTSEDFFARWQKNTAQIADLITLHKGDITKERWSGAPIEICFLDVLKTWEILHWSLRNLFPDMRPGSILVHQDFYHLGSYFIPLSMAHLGTCFEKITRIEWSDAIFVQREPISPELLQVDLRKHYTLSQALVLHRTHKAGCNRLEAAELEVQAVMLSMAWGDVAQAKAIRDKLAAEYCDIVRIKSLVAQLDRAFAARSA